MNSKIHPKYSDGDLNKNSTQRANTQYTPIQKNLALEKGSESNPYFNRPEEWAESLPTLQGDDIGQN